ncbi:hypothetical protein [Leptothoe sp. PORK10 BA2]|nr:hypothetical protein [Leptothoe sp. PORK10 BA2]MEA5463753.1 hypothetical protein [Leptothoe sp. PORK10 BA2]
MSDIKYCISIILLGKPISEADYPLLGGVSNGRGGSTVNASIEIPLKY